MDVGASSGILQKTDSAYSSFGSPFRLYFLGRYRVIIYCFLLGWTRYIFVSPQIFPSKIRFFDIYYIQFVPLEFPGMNRSGCVLSEILWRSPSSLGLIWLHNSLFLDQLPYEVEKAKSIMLLNKYLQGRQILDFSKFISTTWTRKDFFRLLLCLVVKKSARTMPNTKGDFSS